MKPRLPLAFLCVILAALPAISFSGNAYGATDYTQDIIIGEAGYAIPGSADDPDEITVEGVISSQAGIETPGILSLQYASRPGTVRFKGDMTGFGGVLQINGGTDAGSTLKTVLDTKAVFSAINAYGRGELLFESGSTVSNSGNLDIQNLVPGSGVGTRIVTMKGTYISTGVPGGNYWESGSLSLCDNSVLNLEAGADVTVRRLVTANSGWGNAETLSALNVKKGAILRVTGKMNGDFNLGDPAGASVYLAHYIGNSEVNVSGTFEALSAYVYGGNRDDFFAVLNIRDGGIMNVYAVALSSRHAKNAVNLEKGGTLNLGGGNAALQEGGFLGGPGHQKLTARGGTLGTWNNICSVKGNIELQEGGIEFNTERYDVNEKGYTGDGAVIAVSGQISQEVGKSGTIWKTGPGTLVLSGDNSYTGGVVLKGGILSLGHENALGQAGNRQVTVDGKASLVNVSTGSPLSLDKLVLTAGSALYVNGSGICSTLSLGGLGIRDGAGAAGGGATLIMDVGSDSNDKVVFSRVPGMESTESLFLALNFWGTPVTGSYTLLQGIGVADGGKVSIRENWGRGLSIVGGMSGNDYVVTVSGTFSNATVHWKGDSVSGIWSVAEPSFWSDVSGYYNGDTVIFGVPMVVDAETGFQTVELDGKVLPASLSLETVEGKNYHFTGMGGVGGSGGVTKSGDGAAVFSNLAPNDYTGETIVQQGILEFRNHSFGGTGSITVNKEGTFKTDRLLSNVMKVDGGLEFSFGLMETVDLFALTNVTWGESSRLVVASGTATNTGGLFLQKMNLVVKEGAAYCMGTDCNNSPSDLYSVTIGGQGILTDGEYSGALYNKNHAWGFGRFKDITLSSDALIRSALYLGSRDITSDIFVNDFNLNGHKLVIAGKNAVLKIGYGVAAQIGSGTLSLENVLLFYRDCRDGSMYGNSTSNIEFKGAGSRLLFNAWYPKIGANITLNNEGRDADKAYDVNDFSYVYPMLWGAAAIPELSGDLKIVNGGVLKLDGDEDVLGGGVGKGNHLVLLGGLSGTGTLYVDATGNNYTEAEDLAVATNSRVRHLYLGAEVAETLDGIKLLGSAILQLGTYQIDTLAVVKNATIEHGLTVMSGATNLVKIVPSGSDAEYTGLNFVKTDETGSNLVFRSANVAYKATVRDMSGDIHDLVLDRGARAEITGAGTLLNAHYLKADGTELVVSGGVLNLEAAFLGGKGDSFSPVSLVQSGGTVNISGEFIVGGGNSSALLKISGGVMNVEKLMVGGANHGALFQLTGGRLNLGAGGLAASQGMPENDVLAGFYLSGGVLAARENWQTSAVLNLVSSAQGSVTVDTTLSGGSGGAAEIVWNGAVKGERGLKIKGEGVLVLSVANSYAGDTILESGRLHVGNNSALGTGKLVIHSGAVLSSLSGAVHLSNGADFGIEAEGEGSVLVFGEEGHMGALSLGGTINVASNITHLETRADLRLGDVASNVESLTKTGTGRLTFAGALAGLKSVEVQKGILAFDTGAAGMGSLQMVRVTEGAGVDMGGSAGSGSISFARAGTLAGASSYAGVLQIGTYGGPDTESAPWAVAAAGATRAGSIFLNNQNARLQVEGSFSSGSVTFTLGRYNATFDENDPKVLVTADSVRITGNSAGSLHLNFDIEYINTYLFSGGGAFRLFSSPVDYAGTGVITYSQPQIIMVDSSRLGVDGSIVWREVDLRGVLLPQDMMEGTYTPQNAIMDYLGADYNGGRPIVVGPDVTYLVVPDEIKAYKLTPGKGTLIYQGRLDAGDKALYVADYSDVTREEEDRSTGAVILTNNANSYRGGTNVSGTTLVVDLSRADNGGLSAEVKAGNLNVEALGTGLVTVTSGKMKWGGVIQLQSYGDEQLEGAGTFTYANDFKLEGGSVLKQAGVNEQVITGNVVSGTGNNALVNSSGKNLVFKGDVVQLAGGTLTLSSERKESAIVFDGAGREFTVETLQMNGSGTVIVRNEYTVKTSGAVIEDGTLSLERDGVLLLGKEGVRGAGTLILKGGMLKSSSSWTSVVAVTLGMGTNTINTGGANVRLYKGVTGEGGFIKQGSGYLYVYDNPDGNARGVTEVRQGRLVLLGAVAEMDRSVSVAPSEYKLNGSLVLESGKGASLQGQINADGNRVTFGDGTHFYLGVSFADGVTGYIRDAGTLTIGTGTQLHVDVLDDTWTTENTYTIFSAREDIQGANNLQLAFNEEYAFVDVSLDLSDSREVGLYLTRKGSQPSGTKNDGTNAGAIHAVVAPLVAGVLDDSTELTGKLHKHMQTISKMTSTEYQTYLTDMGFSASFYYTALSAQVQDVTQHINSVRNRVELLNPVLYDDWREGGIYNVWAGGISHYRDVKSGAEAPGYEMTSWGGELGCAIPLSQTFMIGVGFAYTNTDVQVKDGWGSNDNDTYNVDVFARYRKDALTITGVLTGGFTNTEFHRNQILKNEYTRSNSSTDGNQFMGTIEAGYDFYLNEEKSWILQPLINLTAGRAKLDSLSETGELKNAGLIIGSQSYNMFSAGIGAKLAYQYKTDISDQSGRVELKAMYVNDMGDVDFKVNGRFIGAPGNGFDLNGVSNERSAVVVSAGWIAPISAYGQFFVDAGCEFRKDQNGVNTTVGFSFQF